MKRIILAGLLALGTCLVGAASAEKYASVDKNGKEVVVHTKAAPVIVHRILPPYLGKHVWAGKQK